MLRSDESYISWREPYGMLSGMSRVMEKSEWGAFAVRFIKVLWHHNIAPQLDEIYDVARAAGLDLCPVGA